MAREIRKLRDLGNGSGGVTLPKETLRDWGLLEEDEPADANLILEADDGAVTVKPVS